MLRPVLIAVVSLGLLGFTGCGNSPDAIVKNQINYMNEMSEALEKNEPESKIKEIEAKLDANGKKLNELKLSDEDKKKLMEKYKDELLKALQRFMKAAAGKKVKDFGSFGK